MTTTLHNALSFVDSLAMCLAETPSDSLRPLPSELATQTQAQLQLPYKHIKSSQLLPCQQPYQASWVAISQLNATERARKQPFLTLPSCVY